MSEENQDKAKPSSSGAERLGSDGPPQPPVAEKVETVEDEPKPEAGGSKAGSGKRTRRLLDDTAGEDCPRGGGRRPMAMAIGAGILLGTWALIWLIGDYFAITLLGLGLTLLGTMWYSLMRRRSCADGIIFYSHNQILYYWPIWLGGFVMSDLTGVFGQRSLVEIRGEEVGIMVSSTPSTGLFFLIIIATVILDRKSVV